MKKKIVIGIVVLTLAIVVILWISGIIPKQIAKIYASNYMNNHFPEMKLKYVNIEWSKYHGNYLITFEDINGKNYGCSIGPKYFPISIGEGIFEISENYEDVYKK